jgi:hypothetical protein
MKHAATRILFGYWDTLRGERAAPDRGEIEPGAIRHVLPDTFLLEVTGGGLAEFRLAGTRLCAFFGRELRGLSFHRLFAGVAEGEARRAVEIVTDETAGLVAGLLGSTATGETIELELLLLPLRHRGRTHARLLGTLSPYTVPAWIGHRPLVALEGTSYRVIVPGLPLAPQPGDEPLDDGEPPPPSEADERRRRFVVLPGGRD